MRTLVSCLILPALLSCGEVGPAGSPGAAGPPGPQGDPAPALTPALTGLLPQRLFPERTAAVQLSGVGTHFASGSTVELDDPAIVVGSVTASGPGYLQAQLQVGRAARFGSHDITVDSAAVDPTGQPTGRRERVTLRGALTIAGSLAIDNTASSKQVAQGGVVDFSLRNLDRENPFVGPASVEGAVRTLFQSALGGRIVGYGLADALATPGGMPLHATVGSAGQRLGYALDPSGADVPQVTVRAATALTLGTALAGEHLAMARQGNLYKLTTGTDSQLVLLSFVVSGGLLTSTLAGAVAPSSGRFADGQLIYASTSMATQTVLALLPSRGDAYVAIVAASLAGGADYGYSLTAMAGAAQTVSAKEPAMMPDSPAAPLVDISLDGPRFATDGAIDGPVDIDYVRVKAAKSGPLYVQVVTPGQGLGPATVAVALTQADCTTPVAPQRPVQQEVAATAGGSYCAVLSSPTGYVGPYQLIVTQGL